MKFFEILTFMMCGLMIINFTKKRTVYNIFYRGTGFILFVCIIIISIQNGLLWHYFPIYLFFLIYIWVSITKPKKKFFTVIVLSLLVFLAIDVAILFPFSEMPKTSGEFLIGTKNYDVVDESRIEKYDDLGNKRKIRAQVWYPIDSNKGLKKAKWFIDGKETARGISKDAQLPLFLLDKMSRTKSNSYLGGNLSNKKDKYPLVIISHGWAGVRNFHQDFAEELASRGYIVIAIDHTYGATVTVFEDGKVANINYDAISLGKANFLDKANVLVNTFARDVSRIIDFSHELNASDSMFKSRIDESKIGLIGHSTGGGGDVRLALEDDRIKSIVGLDAWVEPIKTQNVSKGLEIPSLFIRSKEWEVGSNNKNLGLLVDKSSVKPLVYQIDDTKHVDFAMVYMTSPFVKVLGYSGDIDRYVLNDILEETIVSFFDQTFADKNPDILEDANYMREVDYFLIK